MKGYQILGLACMFLVAAALAAPAHAGVAVGESFTAKVIGVLDGDTLVVQPEGGNPMAISLAAVESPGQEAKEFVRDKAMKKQAKVEITAKDGHELRATVEIGGEDLAAALVEAGLAKSTEKAR